MICGIKIIGTTAKTFSDVSNIADNNKPKKVEEIVKKEEQTNNPNRGGVEVNKYSM